MSDSSEKLSNMAMMAMGETVNHLKAEIERLRADVAHWRAAAERAAADRTRELEACPYCRKHGEHAYSPCYLHGGCAEAKVEILADGMFKFTCPVCGVESGMVRQQKKVLAAAKALLREALPSLDYLVNAIGDIEARDVATRIRAALGDDSEPVQKEPAGE